MSRERLRHWWLARKNRCRECRTPLLGRPGEEFCSQRCEEKYAVETAW